MKVDFASYCPKCLLSQKCRGQAKKQMLRRGETLFFSDQPAKHVFLFHQGLAVSFRVTGSGREVPNLVVAPGDVFGFSSAMEALFEPLDSARLVFTPGHSGRYPYHARAVAPSTLCKLSSEQMLDFIRTDHDFAIQMLRIQSARLLQTVRLLSYCGQEHAHSRLANILLLLAERVGLPSSMGTSIPLKLYHEDLAAMAGLSRPTVTRGLIHLRSLGLIGIEKGRIYVKDPASLADMLLQS